MKSRETRQREARDWGLWLLGAVAALLALYVLVEETPLSGTAGLGPVIGASLGAGVAYMLTRRQRRQEDDQRRRALATGLLSEIRLLEPGLRDIHGDTTAAYQVMEPFQTAVYDQAGANLLLFRPATVHALNLFYNGVHELRTTLARSRIPYHDLRSLAQRYPPGDQEHIRIRLMATNVHDVIRDVATRLHQDEGGRWPDTLPPLRFRRVGGQLDVPQLQPSIFEDRKCPPRKRYRCRFCGAVLPAWLSVVKRPDGAMLLGHLSLDHSDQLGLYLDPMRTEDIATVAAEAFEVVTGEAPW